MIRSLSNIKIAEENGINEGRSEEEERERKRDNKNVCLFSIRSQNSRNGIRIEGQDQRRTWSSKDTSNLVR